MKHLAHVIQLYYFHSNIGRPCGYYYGFKKLHCPDEIQCIVELDFCDGVVHCKDGSDENEDFCRSMLKEYYLQCFYFDMSYRRDN